MSPDPFPIAQDDAHASGQDKAETGDGAAVAPAARPTPELSQILAENFREAWILIDSMGILRHFSPGAEALFGYGAREVLGRNVSVLMPDPPASRHQHFVETYLQTGIATILNHARVLEGRHKDGRILPIELWVCEVSFDNTPHFLGIAYDLRRRHAEDSARKEVEQEKDLQIGLLRIACDNRSLEGRLRRALDLLLAQDWLPLAEWGGLYVCHQDPHGFTPSESGTGKAADDLEAILPTDDGPEVGRRKGSPPLVLAAQFQPHDREDREDREGTGSETLPQSLRIKLPTRRRRLDPAKGDPVAALTLEIPLYSESQVGSDSSRALGLLVLRPSRELSARELACLDRLGAAFAVIIERARLDQMRLSASAEQVSQARLARAAFMANITHELRTPLNAIIGFSNLLLERRDAFSLEEVGYLSHIREGGNYLLGIVNNVLKLAMIESGELVLEQEAVPLLNLIDAAIAIVTEDMPRAIDVVSDPTSADPVLLADNRSLRQVLVNLLGNAVKFTAPEDYVGVIVKSLSQGGIEVVVVDEGCGMEPDDIPRALEPFQQIEQNLARTRSGAGLGLAIARSLVTAQGGTLRIESAPLQGTRVSLFFPAPLCNNR